MKKLLFALLSIAVTSVFAQPANDDPCSAISLTAGTSCNLTNATTIDYTASGVSSPSCGSVGRDVWFKTTVPASGQLAIYLENNGSVMLNIGMVIYKTSNCNNITNEVLCFQDFTCNKKALKYIDPSLGLANQQIYIRISQPGDYNLGAFQICAYDPGDMLTADKDLYTVDELVNNVLVTGCLTATNINYTGSPDGIGYYTGGNIFGFGDNNGIILSSGDVTLAKGPNDASNTTTHFNTPGNTLLDNIVSPEFTFDAATLEFDFKPQSDTMHFNYLFASEEYHEFVNKAYNDVFAFFLSGPKPGGGTYDNVNIALIPGTSTAVAINNVNNGYADYDETSPGNCTNCQYFIDNVGGTTCEFDGYTTILTAKAPVVQCGDYHIKLCIADVADDALNSAVLLEANSFSSGTGVILDIANATGIKDSYEGCSSQITFTRPDASTIGEDLTFPYNISGTATYNTDYTLSEYPNATIPAGQMAVVIDLNTIQDGITEGQETIIVTNTSGCPCNLVTVEDTIFLHDFADVHGHITTSNTSICNGDDITLESVVTSGNLVGFTWSDGSNVIGHTQDITVSPTTNTTYTVTFRDSCGNSANDNVVIHMKTKSTRPNPFTSPYSICKGESVTITKNGGTLGTGASWKWYKNGCGSGAVIGTGNSITVTPNNTTIYYVRGEGDCNTTLCRQVKVTVNPNPEPEITGTFTICAESDEVYTVTNHTGHSYSWTVTGGNITNGQNSNSITVHWGTGNSGTVHVTETIDATTCDNEDTKDITINPLPNVFAGIDQTISNGTSTSINDATVNGNSNPNGFDYTWTPASDIVNANILHPTTQNLSTTTIFTLTVENQTTHCVNSDNIKITITGGPLSVDIAGNDTAICIGESVTLSATGSGGSGTYNYTWSSTPSGFSSTNDVITVSPTVSTTYTVEVDDGFNTASVDLTVTINPLPTISINCDEADKTLCLGEDVVLTATGNADTYIWNNNVINADAFTPDITNQYIVTATNNTTNCQDFDTIDIVVNPLPYVAAYSNDNDTAVCLGDSLLLYGVGGDADTYTWTPNNISDSVMFAPQNTENYIVTGEITATGCQNFDTISVTVYPLPVIDNIDVIDVTNCPNPNGSLDINVSNGTTPYQYSIDNGTSFSAITLFTDLNGGNYDIIVLDANLCSDTSNTSINNASAPPIDSIVVTDCSCYDDYTGTITIYCSGAVHFSIDNGATSQSNGTFTGLQAGNYQIWVADAGMCVTVDNVTIDQPNELTINEYANEALCGNTGSIHLNVSEGTPPYTYNWSTSETTDSISGLAAGIYTVTVTDAHGCEEILDITVDDAGIDPTVISTVIDVKCYGDSTGRITSMLNNDFAPFVYNWAHDTLLNDSVADDLVEGTYYVTITDSYNCSASDTIIVNQPQAELSVYITNHTDPTCYNDSTGRINLMVDGGTPNYKYLWSNGNTSQNLPAVHAGIYEVTITDHNACEKIISDTLLNPAQMLITDSIFYDNNYGNIIVNPIGGTPDYTYLWSNGETNNEILNLYTGDYYITITDANNCIVSNLYKIDIPLIIPSVITPNNDGKNDKFRITNIQAYRKVDIKIFNRWGDILFDFSGTGEEYGDSSNQWDGTYNGKELPFGSYVYIINVNNDDEHYNGTVTIVR